jgi:S1-C subfamily serine protease
MSVLPPPAPGVPPKPPTRPAPSGRARWPLVVAVGATALVAATAGLVIGAAIDDEEAPAAGAIPTVAINAEPGARLPVRAVAEAVGPSVVTISADVQQGRSVGTGVIVSADGEILTNAHVVDGATEVRVRLPGETEPTEAELLASDVGNDLALLRIDAEGLPPVRFAPSAEVGLGDEVLAIGFALDLDGEPTVTLGIVSAVDRTIITEDGGALDGLIQTDAAISSGNSGGPLVDTGGRIVGINTAVARGDFVTAATNVGFAISSDEVSSVLADLREATEGSARPEGYLGITLNERTDGGQGALVADVEADSPADEVGIEAGDVVISVDGAVTDGRAGVIAAIRDHEPGDEVAVVVVRDGEQRTFDVTLAERVAD